MPGLNSRKLWAARVVGPLILGEVLAGSNEPEDLSSRGQEVPDIEAAFHAEVVLLIGLPDDLEAEDVP